MARLRIQRAKRKRPNRLRLVYPQHDSLMVGGRIHIAFSEGGKRPCTIVLDDRAAQALANTLIGWLPGTISRHRFNIQ